MRSEPGALSVCKLGQHQPVKPNTHKCTFVLLFCILTALKVKKDTNRYGEFFIFTTADKDLVWQHQQTVKYNQQRHREPLINSNSCYEMIKFLVVCATISSLCCDFLFSFTQFIGTVKLTMGEKDTPCDCIEIVFVSM